MLILMFEYHKMKSVNIAIKEFSFLFVWNGFEISDLSLIISLDLRLKNN